MNSTLRKDNLVKQMKKLAEFIDQHADETLPLSRLSEKIGLSPYYLQRSFKSIFGMSPKQYQNAVRLKKLKSSLKEGDAISGAIYEAGFGSTSRVYEQTDHHLGMTLSTYCAGGKGETITYVIRNTVLGHIIMAATERGVCFVHFGDKVSNLLTELEQEFPNANLNESTAATTPELNTWIEALNNYIKQKGPHPSIPLHLNGTVFQMRVWQFLTSVREGQVISYSELAKKIGAPKAARAVANACSANNIAMLIPCHRVLRNDGTLGDYRWGLERKKKLLEKEQNRKK